MSPTRVSRASHVMREDRSPMVPTGGSLVGNLPMRTASFATQHGQMLDYIPHQPHHFDETSMPHHSQAAVNPSIPVDMVHNPAAGDRRGSLFSNFNSPGANPVFSTQWQPVSTAANPNQGYPYAAQPTHADPHAYANAAPVPLPPTEHQAYLSNSFDGLPRSTYDPSSMFRQPEMAPGAGTQPHAYPYTPADAAGLRDADQSMDSDPRHHG
jgi:hypothetical protein